MMISIHNFRSATGFGFFDVRTESKKTEIIQFPVRCTVPAKMYVSAVRTCKILRPLEKSWR